MCLLIANERYFYSWKKKKKINVRLVYFLVSLHLTCEIYSRVYKESKEIIDKDVKTK